MAVPGFAADLALPSGTAGLVPVEIPFTGSSAGTAVPQTGSAVDGAAIGSALDALADFGLDIANEKLWVPERESIVEGFASISAFSIDGGTKWKAGTPSDKDIKKLFDKGGVLALTNDYDTKAKAPNKGVSFKAAVMEDDGTTVKTEAVEYVPSAVLIKFDKIDPRATAPKLAVNYTIYKDDTGKTNGAWTVVEKGKTAEYAVNTLAIAAPADGKKLGADDVWYNWGKLVSPDPDDSTKTIKESCEEGGVWVKDLPETGKVLKSAYFVKVGFTVNTTDKKYVAASKPIKLNVSSLIKAPNLKVDYKKETMKLKAPMNVYFGTEVALADKTPDAIVKGKNADGVAVWPGADNGLIVIPADKKDDAKIPAGVDTVMTPAFKTDADGNIVLDANGKAVATKEGEENTILAWQGATDKKPASGKQTIKLAIRAVTPEEDIAVTEGKGKVTMDKTLQAFDATKKKWGGFPKLTRKSDVLVRVKTTAKQNKDGTYTGNAASAPATYHAGWGVMNQTAIDEGRAKTPPKTVAAKNGVLYVRTDTGMIANAATVLKAYTEAKPYEVTWVGDDTTKDPTLTDAVAALIAGLNVTVVDDSITPDAADENVYPVRFTVASGELEAADETTIYVKYTQAVSASPAAKALKAAVEAVGNEVAADEIGVDATGTGLAYKWFEGATADAYTKDNVTDVDGTDDTLAKQTGISTETYFFCEVTQVETGKAKSLPTVVTIKVTPKVLTDAELIASVASDITTSIAAAVADVDTADRATRAIKTKLNEDFGLTTGGFTVGNAEAQEVTLGNGVKLSLAPSASEDSPYTAVVTVSKGTATPQAVTVTVTVTAS